MNGDTPRPLPITPEILAEAAAAPVIPEPCWGALASIWHAALAAETRETPQLVSTSRN